jgi:hypothetical protein
VMSMFCIDVCDKRRVYVLIYAEFLDSIELNGLIIQFYRLALI